MRFVKKHTKSFVAFLLALLVVMGTLPLSMPSVSAAETESGSTGSDVESQGTPEYLNQLNGWKVASTWSDLSDTYEWNADMSSTRQVKMIITYRLNTAVKDYEPGEVVFTVPGIGNADRSSVTKASDIAGGETDTEWNYEYDKTNDLYTFRNKYTIQADQSINGGFEIVWTLAARNLKNGYEQIKSVTFSDSDGLITLPPLTFRFTSLRDKEVINLEKSPLTGEEFQLFDKNYIWYKYFTNYTELQKARGLYKSTYLVTFTLPENSTVDDILVYDAKNFTDLKDNISKIREADIFEVEAGVYGFYLREESYGSLKPVVRSSFVVGFKEDALEGKQVTLHGHLNCLFYDEDEWTTTPSEGENYDVEDHFTVTSYSFPKPAGNKFVEKYAVDYTKNPYSSRYNSKGLFDNQTVKFRIEGGIIKDYGYATVGSKSGSKSNVSDKEASMGGSVGAELVPMGNFINGDVVLGDNKMAVVLKDGSMRDLTDDEYHFRSIKLPTYRNNSYELYVAYTQNEVYDNYTLISSGTLSKEVKVEFPDDRVKAFYIKILDVEETCDYHPIIEVNYHFDAESEAAKSTNLQIDTQQHISNFVYLRYYAEVDGVVKDIARIDSYVGTYAQTLKQTDLSVFGDVVFRNSTELWLRDSVTNLTSTTLVNPFNEAANHGYTTTIESSGSISAEENGEVKKFSMVTVFPSQLKIDLNKADITISGSVNAPLPLSNYVSYRKTTKDGKTYIVADFDFSSSPLNLKDYSSFKIRYPVSLSYFDYLEHGSYYEAETFVMIQDSSAKLMQIAANELVYDAEDCDNDNDKEERCAHSTNAKTIVETAREWREYTEKSVKSYFTETFEKEAITRKYVPSEPTYKELSEYTYRMSFGIGQDNAKNIIFYDDLENGATVFEGAEAISIPSQWKGSLVEVNTDYAENQGLTATVYYTTASSAPRNLQNSAWTTTAPNDLSTVRGIAVILNTSNLDGGALQSGDATYVDIKMLASPNDNDIGEKAVNQFYVSYDCYDSSGDFLTSYELPSAETYVKLMANVGQKTLRKVDLDAPIQGSDGTVSYQNLAGAKINIYNSNREKINDVPITMSANGEYRMLDMEFGTYFWEEVEAPNGYSLLPGLHEFVIDSYVNKVELLGNHRIPGKVSFYKKDADTNELFILGATYELYTDSGDLVYTDANNNYSTAESAVKCEFTTEMRGVPVVVSNLPWGKYYLKEKAAPNGYALSDKKYYFTISQSELVASVEVANRQERSTACLIKYDSTTNKPISDAKFLLETYSGSEWETVVEDTLKTNAVGEITVGNLLFGRYRWREYIAPAGYEPCEPVEFTIDSTNAGVVTVKMYDDEKDGKARLQKTSTEGIPLKGAVYSLYKANGELVENGLFTDVYGETPEVSGLKWGNYYFQEDKAPNGYILSTSKINFTVNAKTAEYTQVVKATDEKQLGSAKLIKTNTYTNENDKVLLSGAVFNLCKNDGTLIQGNLITDSNGEINVSNLDWGSYYFEETQAPSGYSINPSKIRFSINSSNASRTQEVTCANKQGLCDIKVDKEINEQYEPFGGATFIFVVDGTDNENKHHKYTKSLTIPAGETAGSVVFSGIPNGSYRVYEKTVSRYYQTKVSPVVGSMRPRKETIDGQQKPLALIDMTTDTFAEVKFINKMTQYEKLSHNDTAINIVSTSSKLVGITVDYVGENPLRFTTKASYTFKASDLVVTAFYDNDTSKEIDFSDVVLSPKTVTSDDNATGVGYTVNVSYTENGITVSDTFNVQLDLKVYNTKKRVVFNANGGYFNGDSRLFNEVTYYEKDSDTNCIFSGDYLEAVDQYRDFLGWYTTPDCQAGTEVVVSVTPETESSDSVISFTSLQGQPLNFNGDTELYAKWSTLYCYSSLALAVIDANSLTTEHSDTANVNNAVAILTIDNDTANIKLVNDSVNTPALTITENTNVDLNGKTLEFEGTNGIAYNSDLSLSNGTISTSTQSTLIQESGSASENALNLRSVVMDVEFDGSGTSNELNLFCPSSGTFTLEDVTINAAIVNNKANQTYSFINELQPVDNIISNCSFNLSSDEVVKGQVLGVNATGNVQMTDSELNYAFSMNATSLKRVYGLTSAGGDITVDNSTFTMDLNSTGSAQRSVLAIANLDDVGNNVLSVSDSVVNITYDTTSSATEVIYGIACPTGLSSVLEVENTSVNINTNIDGTVASNGKRVSGIYAYGDDQATFVTSNNDINLVCHIDSERTDNPYNLREYGIYIYGGTYSSTNDVVKCTSDTVENNILRPEAIYIVRANATLDNIYAYITSQASYGAGSGASGYTSAIDLNGATVSITGDSYVHGSHSAILAAGRNMHLTIQGGTFESPGHGAVYFSGRENSTLDIDGINAYNTQNFTESFAPEVLGAQGAMYICDFGCTANIRNSNIVGGKFALRIKYYQDFNNDGIDENTWHRADVNIDGNTYIYGDYYGIHNDLYPGMGVLTVGENVLIEYGGMAPEDPPYDIRAYRGADVVDNRA